MKTEEPLGKTEESPLSSGSHPSQKNWEQKAIHLIETGYHFVILFYLIKQ